MSECRGKEEGEMRIPARVKWVVFMLSFLSIPVHGRPPADSQVVVYTALDQIFSEPIIKEFEVKTGIKVKVVYDTEAAKTTGLVNRLLAEKNNPQADVFWNNEITRSIMLKEKGVLEPYISPSSRDIPATFKDKDGYWTGFAARARVIIYNKGMVFRPPRSIFDLTKPEWNQKFALANPLFGTTATHAACLFAVLGDEKAKQYYRDLKANGVVIVPGNSDSRDRTVAGELPVAFTDTDDAWGAISQGKPAGMVFPDKDGIGTLLIPNTICLIKGAPHFDAAKKFIDYILSREVESKLAYSESMQIPVRPGVAKPAHVPDYEAMQAMDVDFEAAAKKLDESAKFLQELFIQ